LLDLDIARWRDDLQARLARVQQHPEQGLGFIEETICQSALELQRALVQPGRRDACPTLAHAINFSTISPCTSVRRKSRPWKRYVSLV
jgi:hypothetical protein